MSRLTNNAIKEFLHDLGLELKRVREEKNLTIEEAASLAGLFNPSVVTLVENGKKNLNLKYIRLINAYHQKAVVHLEDNPDD